MFIDMTKTLLKLTNILFILKEHDKDKVTTIRQVYTTRHACKR